MSNKKQLKKLTKQIAELTEQVEVLSRKPHPYIPYTCRCDRVRPWWEQTWTSDEFIVTCGKPEPLIKTEPTCSYPGIQPNSTYPGFINQTPNPLESNPKYA